MSASGSISDDFLNKLISIIQDNISDELFGVSELAQSIGMSRSNLLRRIKKTTNLSASQFIRKVRLQNAKDLLGDSSLTVSEVSFKVGFSSTSYFIKCFREEYGYPPGEVGKYAESEFSFTGESKQTHQLAAIMFTDIEGYTALMQKDEEKAIAVRNRHRDAFETITHKYKGRILQYYGDGTLSTFNSAIDAVKCSVELQLAFCEDPKIPVRIGVHTGDILFSKDGILGDGVNVASRIESLAVPGSVFISEKVYDEVKNQSGIEAISMGSFELKNVAKPIEVYSITNTGLVVPEKNQLIGKVEPKFNGLEKKKNKQGKLELLWGLLVIAAIITGYLVAQSGLMDTSKMENRKSENFPGKKSIAVLPFINDSNDSSNVYIINGLMESTLSNLQKIKDLRVISRTSVEKYRNAGKSSAEIARDLNVQYLIEGSGQKIGDQIMLSIQLIDALSDSHLWSEQYNKQLVDIFSLQQEIAKSIADQIEVLITPEEEERINKLPTEDLVAYEFFLQGYDLLTEPTQENLQRSIPYFEKAIEEDNQFARAYAAIAIALFSIDEHKEDKENREKINYYADQALLFDPELAQSLIAKALYYMHGAEYEMAVTYFERALEFNPNSDVTLIFLVKLYAEHFPNTEKYLEYALRGIEIDFKASDSLAASFSYLHISNAFVQSGFVDKAEEYINKSLAYYPDNLFSQYVKAYVMYAKDPDLYQLNRSLLEVFSKDSTRLDIMQEVAKSYYYQRDYENSYRYYKKFEDLRKAYKLDIYRAENAKIGLVYDKVGNKEGSILLFEKYLKMANEDPTIYKNLSLAVYHAYHGEKEKALEYFSLFSQVDNYHYWIILFLDIDPLVDNIKSMRKYEKVKKILEEKFWKYHDEIKENLKRKGLI